MLSLSAFSSAQRCSMFDNCGHKDGIKVELPCPVDNAFAPPKIDQEIRSLLIETCGEEWEELDNICCSKGQLLSLRDNLKRAKPLIESCPACMKNFNNLFCHFTCSPNQANFLDITETEASNDGRKIVKEVSLNINSNWAQTFYDSCKYIKFSATNGFVMDLLGGGAQNFQDFLQFLGDFKPQLNGSPFQINFKFNDNRQDKLSFNEDVYNCDDSTYKCACFDCQLTCPKIKPLNNKICTVGKLPCFSFSILATYILGFIVIAFWFYYYRKGSIEFTLLSKNDFIEEDIPLNEITNNKDVTTFGETCVTRNDSSIAKPYKFNTLLANFIEPISILATERPLLILFAIMVIVFSFAALLFQFGDLEQDPINLWVSKKSPKYLEKQYFDEHFGPFYRTEQIFVVNETGPVFSSYDTVKWWVDIENEIVNNITSSENVTYKDLCFRPASDYDCVIESFTQYFKGDIPESKYWKYKLNACTKHPVNCLPTFQQPLRTNLLFSDPDPFKANAFVVTFLLSNHSNSAILWEQQLEKYLVNLRNNAPDGLRISFNTEISLKKELNNNGDMWTVCVSYLVMFVYASYALKRKMGGTRIILGLAGISIVATSVICAAGFLSFFGVKSTLIIAEVIPFLILAIGIDNIFLITHELDRISEGYRSLTLEQKIVKSMMRVFPSIVLSLICQAGCFMLAAFVSMPAVRNFALYSATSVVFNVGLQSTAFVSILTLYEKKYQNDDVMASTTYSDTVLGNEIAETKETKNSVISKYFAFTIYKKTILTVFVLWTMVSLIFLPGIKFGLDQTLAVPQDSYLIDYFNDIYDYLKVGPPVYFVVKNLDLTKRSDQLKVCGRFTKCNENSIANILELERNRSTIVEPVANWFDDYMVFLSPSLTKCCKVKKGTREMCPVSSLFAINDNKADDESDSCEQCFKKGQWKYDMTGFPEGTEFMDYFNNWISSPSDPCPLGGNAPYSTSISFNETSIIASVFRTAHKPLTSQEDFIEAYNDAIRISESLEDLDVFAYSPFYIFFVQYRTLLKLTLQLIVGALALIFLSTSLLLGTMHTGSLLALTVIMIIIDIGALMALFNITLNAVSLVNLVICVGLAVEFCVHIARSFTMLPNDSLKDLQLRIEYVMSTVGESVLKGITMTKLIGVSVLAFAQSKIFQIFYFRMWISLIVVASLHSLIFFPVLLTTLGGPYYLDANIDEELATQ